VPDVMGTNIEPKRDFKQAKVRLPTKDPNSKPLIDNESHNSRKVRTATLITFSFNFSLGLQRWFTILKLLGIPLLFGSNQVEQGQGNR